eukprot:826458-Rhodomonas_salina.1
MHDILQLQCAPHTLPKVAMCYAHVLCTCATHICYVSGTGSAVLRADMRVPGDQLARFPPTPQPVPLALSPTRLSGTYLGFSTMLRFHYEWRRV